MGTFRTVLIDDDPDFLHLVESLLGADDRFIVVGQADDVDTATTLIDDLDPDLVVTDLVIAGDRLDALAGFVCAKSAPVVAVLSGHDRADAERRVLDAGAHGFFEKLDVATLPDELVDLIERTGRE